MLLIVIAAIWCVVALFAALIVGGAIRMAEVAEGIQDEPVPAIEDRVCEAS